MNSLPNYRSSLTVKTVDHLAKVDSVMRKLVCAYGVLELPNEDASFSGLVSTIIRQQLSKKAARSILNRLRGIFDGEELHPELLLGVSEDKFREVGVSAAKASYLKGIATFLESEPHFISGLKTMKDETAFEMLTTLKGVGPWTANVFLMFNLGRSDIFPYGDVSLQKAVSHLYGVSRKRTSSFAERWSPHRSAASFYLWKWVDDSNGVYKHKEENKSESPNQYC